MVRLFFSINRQYRYQLRYEISQGKKVKTSKQNADIQEKRNTLQRQITNWRRVQLVYTPHVATLISDTSTQAEESRPQADLAENVNLHLPASLPSSVRSLSEIKGICSAERRLRYAQAHDALAQIRRQRRIIQGLWYFKKINISGTGNRPNTRILTTYKGLTRKLARAVFKYRRAREALLVLDPDGNWKLELQVLRQEDISGPGKDPDESSGKYVMSWIWLLRKADKSNVSETEFNECMRVEWTKTRARMMRWQEEYLILQEEMRRVIAWFEWRASWWERQATRRVNAQPGILGGISAYAYKQADLLYRMARRCADDWLPFLASKDIVPDWAARYPIQPDSIHKKKTASDNDVEAEGEDEEGENEELEKDDSLDIEETRSDVDEDEYEDLDFDYDD